jgi:ABC-2 type transport system ATP-binding protein
MGGDLVIVRAPEQSLSGIRALSYVKKVILNDGAMEITMKDAHLHLPQLLSAISGIQCVETRSPTLNDVFIKLTGRDIREDSPEDPGSWIDSVARYRQRSD